jgi:hypothetical protein
MARELRTFQPLEGPAGARGRVRATLEWLPDAAADDPGTVDLFAVHAGSLARACARPSVSRGT